MNAGPSIRISFLTLSQQELCLLVPLLDDLLPKVPFLKVMTRNDYGKLKCMLYQSDVQEKPNNLSVLSLFLCYLAYNPPSLLLGDLGDRHKYKLNSSCSFVLK